MINSNKANVEEHLIVYNFEDLDATTGLKVPKIKINPILLDIDENSTHPENPYNLFDFLKDG